MFGHTLRNTVKDLNGLQGNANDAIDAIAINYVVIGLNEEIWSQAKILQLTGNKSLECLLELVQDKPSVNMLFTNSSTVRDKNNAPKVESSRITKLEQMFETILKKIDNIDESKSKQICGHCGKVNYAQSSCFKLKTCFKRNSKGHTVKFCKQNDSETASLKAYYKARNTGTRNNGTRNTPKQWRNNWTLHGTPTEHPGTTKPEKTKSNCSLLNCWFKLFIYLFISLYLRFIYT